MPQQRCAEGLKTWFLWGLFHLFQYLPNSSFLHPFDRHQRNIVELYVFTREFIDRTFDLGD